MSHLVFPENFGEQRELLRLIKLKHDADGASSVLIPLFAEHDIDLAADTTAGNSAEVYDTDQKLYYRQTENMVEQRDTLFEPAFSITRAAVQFLKMFYSPNVRRLGDWGITVTHRNRISYPPDFTERVTLIANIKAKHDSFPAGTSPLMPFLTEHSINLNDMAADVATSSSYDANQHTLRRDAEQKTQLRDNLWSPVLTHLHQTADYLMKLYAGNQKRLGDWGFTVDDSLRTPKKRISTVKPNGKTMTHAVVLGSTFTNTGTVELLVYKGKLITGTPVTVYAGETMGMTKGYSTITVANPSTLVAGTYTTIVHR